MIFVNPRHIKQTKSTSIYSEIEMESIHEYIRDVMDGKENDCLTSVRDYLQKESKADWNVPAGFEIDTAQPPYFFIDETSDSCGSYINVQLRKNWVETEETFQARMKREKENDVRRLQQLEKEVVELRKKVEEESDGL